MVLSMMYNKKQGNKTLKAEQVMPFKAELFVEHDAARQKEGLSTQNVEQSSSELQNREVSDRFRSLLVS